MQAAGAEACSHSLTDRTIASGAVDSGSIPLESVMDSILGCAAAGLIFAAAVFIFLCVLRSRRERHGLRTEHYSIACTGSDESKDTGLPGRRMLRAAFISDVHDYFTLSGCEDKLLKAIESERPELVLLGGDIISVIKEKNEAPDSAEALKVLKALAAVYPVVYAEGNHESRFRDRFPELYKTFRTELEAAGVTFLINNKAEYRGISIYGVSLDSRYYDKHLPFIGTDAVMPQKYLIGKLGIPKASDFNILLMHSPMFIKEASEWGADLVLSGHFHGGTIRLPGGRGLMSPQFHFLNRFCSGIHSFGSTEMIVNRGLGTHTFNIRLNDLPELSIIDIYGRT